MKFLSAIAAVAALAAPVASLAIRAPEQVPDLDVALSQVGNSLVRAVVTNGGSETLTLLNHNFFSDVAPIKKVSVFREGTKSTPCCAMDLMLTTHKQDLSLNSVESTAVIC